MAELKPCPMCNGEAALNKVEYSRDSDIAKANGQRVFHGVNCIVCGLNNRGIVGHKTEKEAAERWNRRAPAQQAEPVAWLRTNDDGSLDVCDESMSRSFLVYRSPPSAQQIEAAAYRKAATVASSFSVKLEE